MRSWRYAFSALGLVLCLTGALLMVAGEPILGQNHTGVATIVGIIGIGLISTFTTKSELTRTKKT